jgi:hypothetical protein
MAERTNIIVSSIKPMGEKAGTKATCVKRIKDAK